MAKKQKRELKITQREPYCARCGKALNEFISRKQTEEWYAATGFTHYCIDCQEAYFDEIADRISKHLAFFYACIAFNTPFVEECIPAEGYAEPWITYLDNLRLKKKDVINDTPIGFFSGITDITRVYGIETEKEDFKLYARMEAKGREARNGTQKQREAWGLGPSQEHQYTDEDYEKLDKYYKAYGARILQGGVDPQQDHALRLCAILRLQMDEALAKGKVDQVQKLNKVIQENLASENLRKKDAKPIEDVRIDSIVDALERHGYMKNGRILPYDKLLDKLRGDVPRYSYTRDAADQMLLYIINTMQANEGLPEYATLPPDIHIKDEHGEFAEEPNKREKEAYEKLGLLRMQNPKENNDGDQKNR